MSLLLPRPCSARILSGRPVCLQRGRCARCRLLAKASLSVSRVSHHQAFASVLSPAGVVGAGFVGAQGTGAPAYYQSLLLLHPEAGCDISRRFWLSAVEDSGVILLSPEAWVGTPLESSGQLSGGSSGSTVCDHIYRRYFDIVHFNP